MTTPTISFDTAASQLAEGNYSSNTVTVKATLSSASNTVVTVPITYSGTAAATDYNNKATLITINAGATEGFASFSVVGDPTFESNETVILTMGTPTGATLGTNTTHTHTITNDDAAPTVYFQGGNEGFTEGNGGVAQPLDSSSEVYSFRAYISSAIDSAVTIPLYVVGGSATSGTDYTGMPTSITIPANSTYGTASFNIVGDTAVRNGHPIKWSCSWTKLST
jgi:hypothetical protein